MPTKLSRYTEGVMEAAWLAALVMAPLFFNKYSSRIFEPDKATLIRTLALIMVCAWLVKLVDQGISKDQLKNFSFKNLIRIPMMGPVLALTLAYIIATILSVTPRISFWGSYQRLQGMYTTLAYIILFAGLAGNVKNRQQINRIVTTAILTSLPVSLYGILQRYGIDPIPWGGDVTRRVASHMGNPIFVAAYLIMVFPLTVGRIVDSFQKILTEEKNLGSHTARSTVYIFIAALQLIAIFFSQSRGPWLGLFAGGFFLFVLLSLFWRKRWLTAVILIIALLAGSFLVVLNIPDGPLENLHQIDAFRRLGQLLDPESRTAKVRSLIWGGAAEMVAPHDPLEYPDGHFDPVNVIRPAIGYGPETMHMAYNPFYPPALAYVEARNASPDRSHNETWDSLVITGGFGLLAYLAVFTSVFFYGLKWLGMISSRRQTIIFFAIYFGSGIISAIIFAIWQGIAFAGLGLPFGLILGLVIYLALIALFAKGDEQNSFAPERSLTLIILLSAVVSHFAEINFGISIVSTKTYFFVFAACILAVGYSLTKSGEYTLASEGVETKSANQPKRRRKSKHRQSKNSILLSKPVLIGMFLVALLILPMSFEYISNLWGLQSSAKILWTSLTQVKQGVVSYGVLALMITTWASASIIFTSEATTKESHRWWQNFGIISIGSFMIGLLYSIILSGSLARLARMTISSINEVELQTIRLEGLLTQYYTVLIIILLALAVFLPKKWPASSKQDNFISGIVAVSLFLITIWLSLTTNMRIIHADTAFKMAEPFANSGQWQVANHLYRRAISLSPDEDYYFLFLGRGLLEEAKKQEDPAQKEQAFLNAESDLKQAQEVNPLNPDHTANLARLYSWWALQAPDEDSRFERGKVSDHYYSRVTIISPNNVRLWDEWAILHLNVLQDSDEAFNLLSHSLEIDPKYDWTHALLGDYFMQEYQKMVDEEEKPQTIDKAIYHYEQAIQFQSKNINYYFALAGAYQEKNDLENMIQTLEASLEYAGNNQIWQIEENIARIYAQSQDIPKALLHAQRALQTAPEDQQERISNFIAQLQASP